ncbi:MAG: sulfite exporter TauE/SafE family protein [Rhizobiales bacterium]|nr:sulfite exporter TauE/SafE family protein [Hyphomicrobiales bacterium]
MIDPLYSLSGFVVGMLVGMTGVGGGALMTPILILLFGIHPAAAVGTDLLYAAATKAGGSLMHGYARSIDWRVVKRLASGSVPATLVTLAVLSHFNLRGEAAGSLITLVLSVALFATALVLVFGGSIVAAYRTHVQELDAQRTATTTVLVGALLGVMVSISSVGAGAIGVVALVLLYPHMPIAKIVGSDIAHAVPLTLIAGLGHWMMGSVDWHIIASLLVGSLPGIVLGSYFANRVPERTLQVVLAITLFTVASRIAYDHAATASSIFTAFTRSAAP